MGSRVQAVAGLRSPHASAATTLWTAADFHELGGRNWTAAHLNTIILIQD